MIVGYVVARGDECVSQLDAANDGHSGYTIYSRLIKMAGAMDNPPGEICYSFGINRGSLCDLFGRTWHPINLDYDPGPPPPPKVPKEKKEQKKDGTEGDAEKPLVSGAPSRPKQTQQPRGYSNMGLSYELPHRLGEAVPGSSSGRVNGWQRLAGDKTGTSGRGRGYTGPGPARQPHGRGRGRGGGSRIGTFDKCVHRVLRTLRRL